MVVRVQAVLDLVPLLGGREVCLNIPDGLTVREVIGELVQRHGEALKRKLIDPAIGTLTAVCGWS